MPKDVKKGISYCAILNWGKLMPGKKKVCYAYIFDDIDTSLIIARAEHTLHFEKKKQGWKARFNKIYNIDF